MLAFLVIPIMFAATPATAPPPAEAFFQAVEHQEWGIAQALAPRLPDPNVKNEDGLTPLQAALAAEGDTSTLFKLLIQAGADPSVQREGAPLVWLALKGGHGDEAAWLLDHMPVAARKAFLAQTFEDERPALGWAALQGRAGAVALLLKAGADPNAVDRFHATPLNLAARRGHEAAVAALLAGKADPELADREGYRPLYWAVAHGRTPIVADLLAAGARWAPTNPGGAPLLHIAARLGRRETLGLLLARGAKVEERDPKGWTAFLWAAALGQAGCVQELLARGASPKATLPDGTGALLLLAWGAPGLEEDEASQTADPMATLALLLGTGLDPAARDARGQTALHRAVGSKDPAFLEALAKGGCPVQAQDEQGCTALDEAVGAATLQDDGLRWCLKAGLSIQQKNRKGWAAMLDLAVTGYHGGLWTELLASEANLRVTAPDGRTLMHLARPELLEDLVARGLAVDVADNRGRTRLMGAVDALRPEEVRTLLALGADPLRKDAKGRTALEHLRALPPQAEGFGTLEDLLRNPGQVERIVPHKGVPEDDAR